MHVVKPCAKAAAGQRNMSLEHNVAQSQLFTAHESKCVKSGLLKKKGGDMCNPHGVPPQTTPPPPPLVHPQNSLLFAQRTVRPLGLVE